ncbi:hypothetical protein [Vibrio metschnikovii]|uniref:hypothetical protein n=1 Tax=Vibrio metschnikovii TaxID=28172 RepID=UPI001C30A9BC|nr:hypothetical protein [Vibrio metschnikovii]
MSLTEIITICAFLIGGTFTLKSYNPDTFDKSIIVLIFGACFIVLSSAVSWDMAISYLTKGSEDIGLLETASQLTKYLGDIYLISFTWFFSSIFIMFLPQKANLDPKDKE